MSIFRSIKDIINKPDKPKPKPGHVRVRGNKLISPDGVETFLRIFVWANGFENKVSHKTIINFMSTIRAMGGNCILLKANMWMVDDDGEPNPFRITGLHNLIKEAERRGLYTILNLFDTWGRGRGGVAYNTNSKTHPIDVWNRNHTSAASEYIKWMTREYMVYPRVIFEIGNEMAHIKSGHGQNWKTFHWMATNHLLPHFIISPEKIALLGSVKARCGQCPLMSYLTTIL